jgi:hypothetical protein
LALLIDPNRGATIFAWAPPKLKPTAIRSPRPTYDRSEQAGHHVLTDAFYFNLAEFEIAMPVPVFLLRRGLAAPKQCRLAKVVEKFIVARAISSQTTETNG